MAQDNFMPELPLTHPDLLVALLDCLLNIVKGLKNPKKQVMWFKLYLINELDEDCFADDATYADSKDVVKRTISEKISKDKSYEIVLNPQYDWYQWGLGSMVLKFFDKNRIRCKCKWSTSSRITQTTD